MRKMLLLSVVFVGVASLASAQTGRWKAGGDGSCYWDQYDGGPDQCVPVQPEVVESVTNQIQAVADLGYAECDQVEDEQLKWSCNETAKEAAEAASAFGLIGGGVGAAIDAYVAYCVTYDLYMKLQDYLRQEYYSPIDWSLAPRAVFVEFNIELAMLTLRQLH